MIECKRKRGGKNDMFEKKNDYKIMQMMVTKDDDNSNENEIKMIMSEKMMVAMIQRLWDSW